MARHASSCHGFGSLRMVRDLFHIPGKVRIDIQGRILKITLNRDHVHAAKFLAVIALALSSDDLVLNLRQI
jgi:hypothetical protein